MEKIGVKIAVIGGGTGSFAILNGLKNYTAHITALVSMADDGGSTGQLRDELGVLPPGDIRKCLVALSESPKVRDLFNYRFEEGTLSGHAFGNLFLTALEKLTGNFAEAVETASEVLRVQGRVVPITLDDVRLKMTWPEQQVVLKGEGVIDDEQFAHNPREASLSLVPGGQANPAAIEAIEQADIVVISPGDLYTSLGPALVAEGIGEALERTKAKVVYVCNLVTKKGQTDGFAASDHAAEIERFIGAPVLDTVFYNNVKPGQELLDKYAKEGEYWVEADEEKLRNAHYETKGLALLSSEVETPNGAGDKLSHLRTYIRHDSDKVARSLMKLYFS